MRTQEKIKLVLRLIGLFLTLKSFAIGVIVRFRAVITAAKKIFNFIFCLFANNWLIKGSVNGLSSFLKVAWVIRHRTLLTIILVLIGLNSQAKNECPPKSVFLIQSGPHKGKALMCDFAAEYYILMFEGKQKEASKWLLNPIRFNFEIEDLKTERL